MSRREVDGILMGTNAWKGYALAWALVIVVLSIFGPPVTHIGFFVAAFLIPVIVFVGPIRWRNTGPDIVIAFSLGSLAFCLSAILRTARGEWGAQLHARATPGDYTDLLGIASFGAAAYLLARRRDVRGDRRNLLDSLILVCGAGSSLWSLVMWPRIHGGDLANAETQLYLASCFLILVMLFSIGRLTLASAGWLTSFVPLSLAGFFAVLSQSTAVNRGGAQDHVSLSAAMAAMVCVGVALLHPSMKKLSEPVFTSMRLTRLRMTVMALSWMVPIGFLWAEVWGRGAEAPEMVGQLAILMIAMMLTMTRLTGILRANELLAEMERLNKLVVQDLVGLQERSKLAERVVTLLEQGPLARAGGLRVSLARRTSEGWAILHSRGECAFEGHDLVMPPEAMSARYADHDLYVSRQPELQLDAAGSAPAYVLIARSTMAQNLQLALLVRSKRVLRSEIGPMLVGLVNDVALALSSQQLQESLQKTEYEARFQLLTRNSSDVTFVVDELGTVSYASPSLRQVLGFSPKRAIGQSVLSVLSPMEMSRGANIIAKLVHSQERVITEEVRARTATGEFRHFEVVVTDFRHEPAVNGIVINAHDITLRKNLEEDLRHQVLHDGLTGIANRVLFLEHVAHAIKQRPTDGHMTAILCIDINDFQTINDGLGQSNGDEILKIAAFRLEASVRPQDNAARLGGDVFGVLLQDLSSEAEATAAAQRILASFAEEIEIAESTISLAASVGIAVIESGIDADEALSRADVAMHRSKREGHGPIQIFDVGMHQGVLERLEVRAELANALSRNELWVAYQPILSVTSGKLLGFEALMRWNNAKRGPIGPDVFVPLAEESGLIGQMGEWILEEAIRQLAEWNTKSTHPLMMNINVSQVQLRHDGFVAKLHRVLYSFGVRPSQVMIEITESIDIHDSALRQLREMRRLGVEIAADDFGTGYASYASIQQMPYTCVKIDRSIILGINETDGRALTQVESIVTMAHGLGLSVTAEGVEEHDQMELLHRIGVDRAQGFFFSRPISASDATSWVTGRHTLADA